MWFFGCLLPLELPPFFLTLLLKMNSTLQEKEIFTSLSAARSLLEQKQHRPLLLVEDSALEDFTGTELWVCVCERVRGWETMLFHFLFRFFDFFCNSFVSAVKSLNLKMKNHSLVIVHHFSYWVIVHHSAYRCWKPRVSIPIGLFFSGYKTHLGFILMTIFKRVCECFLNSNSENFQPVAQPSVCVRVDNCCCSRSWPLTSLWRSWDE